MKNLFINIFHEDDLSELEMEEILAGNTCGEVCILQWRQCILPLQ